MAALSNKQTYVVFLQNVPRTIEHVIERPPVSELIRVGAKRASIEACLAFEITRIANMITVGGNLREGQSLEIAIQLIGDYPNESLEDFCLCLRSGLKGKYGEIFRFDYMVIYSWFQTYLEEKYDVVEATLMREKDNNYASFKTETVVPTAHRFQMGDDYSWKYAPVKDKKARRIAFESTWRFMSLQQTGKPIPPLSDKDVQKEGKQKPVKKWHPPTTIEQLQVRELHVEWIRENFDAITGKPLPTWIDEPTWLKKKSESFNPLPMKTEEISAEEFFKKESNKQWMENGGSSASSITRIPYMVQPAVCKVMQEYAEKYASSKCAELLQENAELKLKCAELNASKSELVEALQSVVRLEKLIVYSDPVPKQWEDEAHAIDKMLSTIKELVRKSKSLSPETKN